jgi:2-methylcitrate dehydratase PrpD
MTIAIELALRIKEFNYDGLPDEAVSWAKTAILDTVGVTLAGSSEQCVRILEKIQSPGSGPCQIFGRDKRTNPLDASLINGTASHALDFDDFATTIGGHPSVPLVPALMALGEIQDTSGKKLLTAYIAGYETQSRIAKGVNFHHYEKGWHPTATLGIFGTVAASAHLLELNEKQTATALAIAVSLASGVKANFGTMTKPLHIGHSVRNGVQAVLLASHGFTANLEAFEEKQGFLNVFNGPENFNVDKIFEDWANPLDIIDPGLGLKQFPCCGSTHPAINCMLNLFGTEKINVDQVASINILTNPRRLPHTNNPDPQSPLEAKFSIQYAVARALVDGCVTLDHFEDDAFNDSRVRKIMNCISVWEHPEMGVETDNQFGAEVIVVCENDKTVSSRIDHQVGRGPSNPMTKNELWDKFEDCAKRVLFRDSIVELFDKLDRFETISTITEITGTMNTDIRKIEVC